MKFRNWIEGDVGFFFENPFQYIKRDQLVKCAGLQ
jgi:hypothetical protein